MGKLTAHKLKRELRRVGRQIRGFPGEVWHFITATPFYDAFEAVKVRRWTGSVPQNDKVLVYVLYPNDRLLRSHLAAIRYFSTRGFSVVAVSNLALNETDRETLLNEVTEYIERPNVGYDFGGYREAMRHMRDRLPKLRQLVLMNDSTWFPLPSGRDWLTDVESEGADYVSASAHYSCRRFEAQDFMQQTWNFTTEHRNFHYASYALSLSGNILSDPRFPAFWDGYRLTDDKNRTVRRGEIGLTRWVLKNGYTTGSTLKVADLDRQLEHLSDERLARLARNVILITDPDLLTVKRQIFRDEVMPDRKTAIQLLLAGAARQGAGYALADYTLRECGFPFLKKSPVWLDEEMSDITLHLLNRTEGRDAAVFLDEALAWRKARGRGFAKPRITARSSNEAEHETPPALDIDSGTASAE